MGISASLTLINAIIALFCVGFYRTLSEAPSIFSVRHLHYVSTGSHFSCSDYINLKVQHGGSNDI